ncbi:MAG: hypothetical protein JXA58_00695 [Dehalococcoidia bacterium]|nr:hypothetical protein [Dehalococcoidia bacterium]
MSSNMTSRRLCLFSTFPAVVILLLSACSPTTLPTVAPIPAPTTTTEPVPPRPYFLSTANSWELPADRPTGRVPSQQGLIRIEGLGDFAFDPLEIETTRPDLFREGHFSVFDVVAHLGNREWFPLRYHYNDRLDTHVIDELDGRINWWYRAHCPEGWPEINAYRMDMAPYRDGMVITLHTQPEEYMGRIYASFAEELLRRSINLGRVVIPEIRIGTAVHFNVPVSAHDLRDDVLQPGAITALDVLLSLGDQGKINRLKLTWYSDTAGLEPADSFHVEQIDDGDGIYDAEASIETGRWVYETGSREFSGFKGSHIHIPADVRVIVSPEYMTWYWLDPAA